MNISFMYHVMYLWWIVVTRYRANRPRPPRCSHIFLLLCNYIPDLRKPWPKKIPKTMFRGRSLHDVNIMKVDRILTMVK